MAWDVELVELLRVLVGDTGTVQTYSDEKLMKVLTVAAFQVQQDLPFPTDYAISVSNLSISPDPTEGAGRDDSYANLTCLKAAAIVDHGGAVVAAQRAIAVKDGGSSVDLRDVFKSKLALLRQGWSAVYADAKLEYQANALQAAGAMVLTPFRLYPFGNCGQTYQLEFERNRGGYF